MLRVRAQAGRSCIHGLGLIAQEFIPAGTPVWVFEPGFDRAILPRALGDLAEEERQAFYRYGWLDENWGRVLLSADDDRYTNHSDTPNIRWDDGEGGMVAVRDIRKGEEITTDYRELGGGEHFAWGKWLARRARRPRKKT
jgi:SET domain-containing protein